MTIISQKLQSIEQYFNYSVMFIMLYNVALLKKKCQNFLGVTFKDENFSVIFVFQDFTKCIPTKDLSLSLL